MKNKKRQAGVWEKRIWELIVGYVNAKEPGRLRAFENLVAEGMEWIAGDVESDLPRCEDMRGSTLAALEAKYAPAMLRLVTWLSDPKGNCNLAHKAADDLDRWSRIEMQISSGDAPEYLLSEWPDVMPSVLSGVARFVIDQINEHDVRRKPLRQVVPIGMCEREGCGRFRVIRRQRKGRFFCSNLCKATFHQDRKTKKIRRKK